MQKTPQGMHERCGCQQASGNFFVRLAQLPEPMDQMQIAQTAGRLFDIRFEVIKGVLEFFVPLARKLAQMAGQHAALALEKSLQLVFEFGVSVLRSSRHTW